jgi:anti-anti-sigma factor
VAASTEGFVMERVFKQLDYGEQNGIFCVRVKHQKLQEEDLEELSSELARLVDEAGCRRLVLCLGPGDLECLYSVFLAKLINLQRRLEQVGGRMALAETSPNTHDVFRATGLEKYFKFYPDQSSAVQSLV